MSAALLEVSGLEVAFPARGGLVGGRRLLRAVRDVSFAIAPGEVLGLVGESGSGKTTTGRAVLRLATPTAGQVRFAGADITHLGRGAMRPFRRRMQMIFQDPSSSLDPRQRVRHILGEAFAIHDIGTRGDRADRAAALLRQVGLPADALEKFPHEFSGGQRQRIGIARALAVEPDFLVADEAVSALDVSVQAQVLNLLAELQQSMRLAMLFIAHDLAVVQYLCHRVAVMYLGRVVEIAPRERLYAAPRHPYTAALLDAVPDPAQRRIPAALAGETPSPFAPPSGCVFRTRCAHAITACAEAVPPLRQVAPGHATACIRDGIL